MPRKKRPNTSGNPKKASTKQESPPMNDAASNKDNDSADDLTNDQKDDRDPAVIRAEKIRTGGGRETAEAIVVAFILALLFRAFVAEAFVIPTGSMAPTLMGAHKDLTCDTCGHDFQVGASIERRSPEEKTTVVAGTCPNCRHVNLLDLKNESNDGTFNGDRILVSKFAYTISEPKRWDVIVFKFPGNPKQNYIKRLVGLPNETLQVSHGDIFVKPNGSNQNVEIQRKPPEKLLAMRHHVYDTDNQSDLLIKSGFPSRIQPWESGASEPPTDSWSVKRSTDGLVATVKSADDARQHWIRYFHNWPTKAHWDAAKNGQKLDSVDPYTSTAITDFYAYDCYITVPSSAVYTKSPYYSTVLFGSKSGVFRDDFKSGESIENLSHLLQIGQMGLADYGMHWVGDLIMETDVELGNDCKELALEIVEAGVKYSCTVDLTNGKATLTILEGETPQSFLRADGSLAAKVSAETKLRAGSSASLRFSNCDDQLLFWIDDNLVTFDHPTVFDSRSYRPAERDRPYVSGKHPLDASPVGLAVRGGSATVNRIQLWRDKYYVATDKRFSNIIDYNLNSLLPGESLRNKLPLMQLVLQHPEEWNEFEGWNARRTVSFDLHEDQFFPMGDNSPESLDARCWAGAKSGYALPERYEEQAYRFADASYVPRDLLVGEAVLVFWPHFWRSPVPITPNIKKMRLIR